MTTFESTQDASLEWDHQNLHCFVFMMQSPRSRFVTAWVNMQEGSSFDKRRRYKVGRSAGRPANPYSAELSQKRLSIFFSACRHAQHDRFKRGRCRETCAPGRTGADPETHGLETSCHALSNYPIVRLSIPFHSYRCVRSRFFLSLFARVNEERTNQRAATTPAVSGP